MADIHRPLTTLRVRRVGAANVDTPPGVNLGGRAARPAPDTTTAALRAPTEARGG